MVQITVMGRLIKSFVEPFRVNPLYTSIHNAHSIQLASPCNASENDGNFFIREVFTSNGMARRETNVETKKGLKQA